MSKSNWAIKQLELVKDRVGGEIRISRGGVPHLVIDDYYSVCYFCRNDEFKLWKDYATPNNNKIGTFASMDSLFKEFASLQGVKNV